MTPKRVGATQDCIYLYQSYICWCRECTV